MNAIGVAQFGNPHGVKWLLMVSEMDEYSENEIGSTSSGSPSVNKTENVTFYFGSSERGRSQPSPLKVSRSVDSSSSEEDEEEGEEGDRQTDSPSSSSGESNAEKTTEKKSVVTFSTSAPSAVARSVLYGKALRSRGSSSSFGGEGDSPFHESDDAEFGSSHAHKQQASDASGSSPPPPKRMQQVGSGDGGTVGTTSGAEYSDFARRMMVSCPVMCDCPV